MDAQGIEPRECEMAGRKEPHLVWSRLQQRTSGDPVDRARGGWRQRREDL